MAPLLLLLLLLLPPELYSALCPAFLTTHDCDTSMLVTYPVASPLRQHRTLDDHTAPDSGPVPVGANGVSII